MFKIIAAGILALLVSTGNAAAQSCSGATYTTLTNGNTADATQVMGNLTCILSSPAFSGFVGIGAANSTSDAQLYIYSSSLPAGSYIKSTGGQGYLQLEGATGTASEIYNTINGTTFWASGINGDGAANSYDWYSYAGSQSVFYLQSNGNATLAGTLTQLSDARLKKDVETLSDRDGVAAVELLQPISFKWTDTNRASGEQFGFIAQQVQQVLPSLVDRSGDKSALTPDGALSVNYLGLIPVLTKAIQQLKAQTDNQAVEIQSLKAQLSVLEKRINLKMAQN